MLSYLGTANDITAQRDEERERQALAALVRASADAIIGKDLEGTITELESRRRANLRVPAPRRSSVARSRCSSPRAARPSCPGSSIGSVTAKRIEFMETERLRRDGRRIDVALTVSPMRDASGAAMGASTVARDMSEQKLAERLLESERRQLAEAQRIAKVGSWELDPVDRGAGLVAAAVPQSRLRPGRPGPDPGADLRARPSRGREEISRRHQQISREGTEFEFDFRVVMPDGELRTLEVHGASAAAEPGRAARFLGTSRDVTKERDAERLKDEFFGLVSHELRTPLTSIIGYAEARPRSSSRRT